MKIVFMGTPEFAVESLDRLVSNNYTIAAVVTAPDKPAGRGQKVSESAVKKYAKEKGLKILQPLKLKDPEFLASLKSIDADLQIVIAFRMLPEQVWAMPRLGTFNLHASLLPNYRGAAPINRAIMNGESESGVTTFFLQHEIDTGNIIERVKVPITPDETAGELHDKLMKIGAGLVLDTVRKIENGTVQTYPQDSFEKNESKLKHAPKIFKADCELNWEDDIDKIYNQIRGLSPYPAAFTSFRGLNMKIFRTTREYTSHDHLAGEFFSDGKTFLKVSANKGYLHISDLQLEGKKRMPVEEFLRGFRF